MMVFSAGSLKYIQAYGSQDPYASLQLPSCIFTLCAGALLAYYKSTDAWPHRIVKYDWWVLLFFSIGIIVAIYRGFSSY
jgi:hypothetical protein